MYILLHLEWNLLLEKETSLQRTLSPNCLHCLFTSVERTNLSSYRNKWFIPKVSHYSEVPLNTSPMYYHYNTVWAYIAIPV